MCYWMVINCNCLLSKYDHHRTIIDRICNVYDNCLIKHFEKIKQFNHYSIFLFLAIGTNSANVYMAEITSPKLRGSMMSIGSVMLSFGGFNRVTFLIVIHIKMYRIMSATNSNLLKLISYYLWHLISNFFIYLLSIYRFGLLFQTILNCHIFEGVFDKSL